MLEDIDQLVADGYVTRRKHPSHDLWILNYTPKAQYERLWNDTTMSCRGLVVDGDGRVTARCFRKFFNLDEVRGEVEARMGQGFQTFEKIDGSLGILYWAGGEPMIATRGSFTSDQALRATDMLRCFYPSADLDPEVTLLFEIVYPGNRVCVDYGAREELVMLAAFDTESGREIPTPPGPFPSARSFDLGADFDGIRSLNIRNREGFVVRFEDGFRFKVKFEDYVALHSVIFSVSTRSVWNSVRRGISPADSGLPDEIHSWVRGVESDLAKEYASIESRAAEVFEGIKHLDRREFAAAALDYRCSPVLFRMLDGRPYGDMIWKMVEPEYRTPRKNEEI